MEKLAYLEYETVTLNEDNTFKGRLGYFNEKNPHIALLHKDKTCCFDLDVKKNKNIPIEMQIAFFEDWLASCGFDVNDPFLGDEASFIVKTRSGGRHYVFANQGILTSKCLLKIPFDESGKELIYCDLLCGNSITFFSVPFGQYQILQKPQKLVKISSLDLPKILSHANVSKTEKNHSGLNFHENIEDADLRAILLEISRCIGKRKYSYSLWFKISLFIAFHASSYEDGLSKFMHLSRQTGGFVSEEDVRNQFVFSYKEAQEKGNVIFYDYLKRDIINEGFNYEDISCEKRILIKEIEENMNFLESLRVSVNKPTQEKVENKEEVLNKELENEEISDINEEELLLNELNERINAICFDLMNEGGFFGELVNFIYESTSPKIPNFAVFTAFAVCGCLLSWEYGFSTHMGKSEGQVNLWTVLVNKSSSGKGSYITFIEDVIREMRGKELSCCIEASNPTSVNGLETIFTKNYYKRNALFTFDEYFTKPFLKKDSKEAYTSDLKGAMSSIYDGVLKPPTSKGSTSTKPICNCLVNIFGVSVESFKDLDLTQGIMNRHIFVFPSTKEEEMSPEDEMINIHKNNQNIENMYSERKKAFLDNFKSKYLKIFLKHESKKDLINSYYQNGLIQACVDEFDALKSEKSMAEIQKNTKEAMEEEKEQILYQKIWFPNVIKAKRSDNFKEDMYTIFEFYLKNENKLYYDTKNHVFETKTPRIKSGLTERVSFISAKMACILAVSRSMNVITKELFLQMFELCYLTREVHSLKIAEPEIAYTQQEKSFGSVLDKFIEKIENNEFWKKNVNSQGYLTPSRAVNRLRFLKPLKGADLNNLFARVATLYPEKYEILMEGKNISLRRKTL